MTQMSYRPYKFSLQKTWGKSSLREVKYHLLKTLQPVCRKVKKQRSTDLIDAPPRQRNEFSKENSGGLQDQYAVSRPICAVRNGTGKEIADYLDIKFSRLGKVRTKIITDEGCEALAAKLRKQTRS